MTNEIEYFKVLNINRMPFNGGQGQWTYRKWRIVKGPLIPCRNGLHVCSIEQLLSWLGPEIWQIKIKESSENIVQQDKIIVRSAKLIKKLNWNEKTARLFAADCAEHVLQNFENTHPKDLRPREAIQMARSVANKKIKLDSAAYSAARSAAYSAADLAARSAAYLAADSAARSAAYSAADLAADLAAYLAADSAARSAAYSAAYLAAYSAARSAARSAAYSAARSAAYSAADLAADLAERKWQSQLLHKYLFNEI